MEILFFKGVPSLECLETLKARTSCEQGPRPWYTLEIIHVCVCDRLLGKWLLETHRG